MKNIISPKTTEVSLDDLLTALSLDKKDDATDEIKSILDEVNKIATPKAVFMPLKPIANNEIIVLNDIELKEPFVYEMLLNKEIVVPYVATCGVEIEKWSNSLTDFFNQFVVENLKQLYLRLMVKELFAVIKSKYFKGYSYISTINPGSLNDWAIAGQAPLFEIFGDVENNIGVTLKDNFFMTPAKSVSGIIFQTDEQCSNCLLCTRTDCPTRIKPYIEGYV